MSNEDLLSMLNAAVAKAPAAPAPTPVLGAMGDAAIIAASKAMTDNAPLAPAMARPFLPHQAAAFNYCLASIARWGGVLIGDDMGMGKTQVMLALIAARKGAGPAIVIAPPVTLAGWKGDLKAAFPGLTMFHAQGRTATAIPAGTDIVFISHDPLTMRAWLTDGLDSKKNFIISDLAKSASIVCRDEAHSDKGANGKPQSPTSRARLMLTLGNALHDLNVPTVAATGTLLTNGRPIEMVIPIQFVGGKRLLFALAPGARTIYDFAAQYCAPVNNGFGMTYGCDRSKMPQLHALLRSTCMVRRDKDDLGSFLPARRWLVRPLALNGVLSRYNALARDVLAVIRSENGPAAYMRAARAEKLVQIMKLWEEAGTAKAAAAVEYVTDLVDEGRPVVLFFQHGAALKILQDGLSKAGIPTGQIIGGQSPSTRERQIARFQGGQDKVILCQLQAAGLGVTLTAAADAVFLQTPWSSGLLKQAADRIVRVDDRTQARAIAGEHITWHCLQACQSDGKPTFDQYMFDVVQSKAAISDSVNSGAEITMPDESVFTEAITAWYADNA